MSAYIAEIHWSWDAAGQITQFILVLLVASVPVALPAVMSVTLALGALALSKQRAIVSRLSAIDELAGVDGAAASRIRKSPICSTAFCECDLADRARPSGGRPERRPARPQAVASTLSHLPSRSTCAFSARPLRKAASALAAFASCQNPTAAL